MPVSFPWSLDINKGTPRPKFGITEDNGKGSGKIAMLETCQRGFSSAQKKSTDLGVTDDSVQV